MSLLIYRLMLRLLSVVMFRTQHTKMSQKLLYSIVDCKRIACMKLEIQQFVSMNIDRTIYFSDDDMGLHIY